MSRDEIDRILAKEEGILPSPGFADSVMRAVRREAAIPPPIPFPWEVALSGIVAAAGTLVYVLVKTVVESQAASVTPQFSAPWTSLLTDVVKAVSSPEASWVGLSALLTLASLSLSTHLASWKLRHRIPSS